MYSKCSDSAGGYFYVTPRIPTQPSLVVHDAAKYTQVSASCRGGLRVDCAA